jgi:hypothetical protein
MENTRLQNRLYRSQGTPVHSIKQSCLRAYLLKHLWVAGFGTRRNKHVDFSNRYLLLLEEEHTDVQASRLCGKVGRA